MNVCAFSTNEGAVSDRGMSAFVSVAVNAELVVGITGQKFLKQSSQWCWLFKVKICGSYL